MDNWLESLFTQESPQAETPTSPTKRRRMLDTFSYLASDTSPQGPKSSQPNAPKRGLDRLYDIMNKTSSSSTIDYRRPGVRLHSAVEWVESRGKVNAVSPKGAIGPMQTMPGTLRDPGYGVAPAKDNSVAELRRVGQDYIDAMYGKYGLKGGLAAYNWGPGNWERALKRAGGNVDKALASAPKETREYVPAVLNRMDSM